MMSDSSFERAQGPDFGVPSKGREGERRPVVLQEALQFDSLEIFHCPAEASPELQMQFLGYQQETLLR